MTSSVLFASPSNILTCKTMGGRLRDKIGKSTDGLDGTVLNVFDSTINIKTDDDELLIVSLGNVASPITLNIEYLESRNRSKKLNSLSNFVLAGDRACILEEVAPRSDKIDNITTKISLGNATIIVDRPNYFENKIQRFHRRSLSNFLVHGEYLSLVLRECATSSGRQGCLLNPDMTTKGLLSEFLETVYDGADALDIVASREVESRLCRALLGLCGRGPGFTPAGDDFISGFLAMFNYICGSLNRGSSSAIIPGPSFACLTSWISFKLMEYNAAGLVDMEIQALINSAAQGDVLSYADKIRSLSKRGHTSGLDFSTGATFALCMAANSIIAE